MKKMKISNAVAEHFAFALYMVKEKEHPKHFLFQRLASFAHFMVENGVPGIYRSKLADEYIHLLTLFLDNKPMPEDVQTIFQYWVENYDRINSARM